MGFRGWIETPAVPISMVEVTVPMSAAAVRASKSSGICGTHNDANPASSAQVASATMRSTLVAYRPRSGPTITPIRTGHVPFVAGRTAGPQPPGWWARYVSRRRGGSVGSDRRLDDDIHARRAAVGHPGLPPHLD